jgi:hypothetical protein
MKRIPINCIIFLVLTLLCIAGCKKSKFDSTKSSKSDFVGTWHGSISTFRHNQTVTKSGDFIIFFNSTQYTLLGLLILDETNIIQMTQFNSGTFYFSVLCNDPENATCQNWSLAGFAKLEEQGKMDIYISGNICGLLGDQFVDYTGTMNQTSPNPDSSYLYTFARAGRQWNYKITLVNNDTCHVQDNLISAGFSNIYQGQNLNSCGWQPPSFNYYCFASPLYFQYILNPDPSTVYSEFPIDAPLNSQRIFAYEPDTTYVTLVTESENVTVPAGTFSCREFKLDCRVHSAGNHLVSGYYWLNNQYGVIKYEPLGITQLTDIAIKELLSKNF